VNLKARLVEWIVASLLVVTIAQTMTALAETAASNANWGDIASVLSLPPTLTPGNGFTGPTAQPDAISPNDRYGNEPAIAKWDVVPFQTFDGQFNIGVVAFDIAGIDHVEFSVNGSGWTTVRSMTLNPQTGVVEYWVIIQAKDFAQDGPIEVRAVAYPNVGIPTVLNSLTLYANAGHTLPSPPLYVSGDAGEDSNPGTNDLPLATLSRALDEVQDGGQIIILSPGRYAVDLTKARSMRRRADIQRWITIQPADGLPPHQVIISQAKRGVIYPNINRLHFMGVDFDFHTIVEIYMQPTYQIWFDKCRWYDSVGVGAQYPFFMSQISGNESPQGSYVTDSVAEDMFYGFIGQAMVRNCQIRGIFSDALLNSQLIINVVVEGLIGDVGMAKFKAHPDVLQLFGKHLNVIAYGITATDISGAQDLFLDKTGSQFRNMAFVNLKFRNREGEGPPFSQMCSASENVLYQNVQWDNQRMEFRTDFTGRSKYTARNVVFRSCRLSPLTWRRYINGAVPPGVQFLNCEMSQ
jgi:antitoxin (DNA-binding transcriptional repressor) of toxin-antitoxin stability system